MADNRFRRLYSNIYVSNTSWLIFERALRLVVMGIVGVMIARYLGPQRFGLLSYAQSYLALFVIFAGLALDSVVTRELVKHPMEQARILGTAFVLRLLGSLLTWSCIGLSFFLFDVSGEEGLLIAILAVGVLFQSSAVIDFFFQSRVESKYVVKARLAQLCLSSILKLSLIVLEVELPLFAAVIALDHMLLAVGLFYIYRQQGKSIGEWRPQASLLKKFLAGVFPFLLGAFAMVGMMNIDQLMIKVFRSESEVGWYAAAVMISSVWYFIPVAVGSTFNPYIVRNSDAEVSNKFIRLLFSMMTVVSVLGAMGAYFLAPSVVDVLFGSAFAPTAEILMVHILNGIFVFHVFLRSRILISLDMQWYSTIVMLGALIVNVLGNLALVPQFGAIGAAWSSVFAWGVAVLVLPLFLATTRRFVVIFIRLRFSGALEVLRTLNI